MWFIVIGAFIWMIIFWILYLIFEKFIFSVYFPKWDLREIILTNHPKIISEIESEIVELKKIYEKRILEAKREAENIISTYVVEANSIAARELAKYDSDTRIIIEQELKKIEEEINQLEEVIAQASQSMVGKLRKMLQI